MRKKWEREREKCWSGREILKEGEREIERKEREKNWEKREREKLREKREKLV